MKNLLLGLSLAGNLALGYTLLKKTDALAELNEKADTLSDQLQGKAEQVKGALTGDTSDKISGNLKSAKGDLKEKAADLKDELED
ncbi:CsbD family protein [Fructilactobacillus frigidiflavus]|uniref:CsbD family protein n=1 Tax=Fructilactobacillus frigidiflavus TaxID=3242688 RepID=UPI0037562D92